MPTLITQPYGLHHETDFGIALLAAVWQRWGEHIKPGLWACMLPGVRFPRHVHCVVNDYGTLVEVPA